MLLRPPFASNCDAALNDHKCATLLFWYWATRPGDSVANSVTTCELVGSSFNSSEVMTVPDVAEVVSMSGVPELTSTLSVAAPTSSWTSISLSSAVCSVTPPRSAVLNPGAFTVKRSEEHTSELQSRGHLVCRLLLEKKKNN